MTPKAQKAAKKLSADPSLLLKCAESGQIDKDVPRTNLPPGLSTAQADAYRSAIRAVLTAYCNFNKSVGYVQGMNILVSALLFTICDDWSRIDEAVQPTLLLLVNLMEGYQLADLYQKQMLRVLKLLKELEGRVEKDLPQLFHHICATDVP